jgi:hypothetical protein
VFKHFNSTVKKSYTRWNQLIVKKVTITWILKKFSAISLYQEVDESVTQSSRNGSSDQLWNVRELVPDYTEEHHKTTIFILAADRN